MKFQRIVQLVTFCLSLFLFVNSAGAGQLDISPVPVGYTMAEWRELLEGAIVNGAKVEIGGLDIHTISVNEPLIFEGTGEPVNFVVLDEDEMARMGVEPGDDASESGLLASSFSNTHEGKTVFIGKDDSQYSDLGEIMPERRSSSISTSAGQSSAAPMCTPDDCTSSNYWCQLWNDENGSGLLVNNDSYIQITGSAAWRTFWKRTGVARFYNDRNGNYAHLPVGLPNSARTKTYTTRYAYTGYIMNEGMTEYVWIVTSPMSWVVLGENGWDDIKLRADGLVNMNHIAIDHIEIVHNHHKILDLDTNIVLSSVRRFTGLGGHIQDYVRGLIPDNVTDPNVLTAIEEYAQGGSKYYSLGTWSHNFPPAIQPRWWCSEFASWVARQNNPALTDGPDGGLRFPYRYGPTPVALQQQYGYGTQYPNDLGVRDLRAWGIVMNKAKFFAKDSPDETLGEMNGPTQAEWASLQYGVDEGDIVLKNNTTDGHSMIFAGWYDGTDLDPTNFDADRDCNMMWVIGGNESGAGPVLGRVNTHKAVVCREKAMGGKPTPSECGDLDGDGSNDACSIYLWDSLPENGVAQGGAFVDTD